MRIRCGCRRLERPEFMVDLSALAAEDRPRGDAQVCSACWMQMAHRPADRAEILRKMGRPAAEVARQKAKADTIGRPGARRRGG